MPLLELEAEPEKDGVNGKRAGTTGKDAWYSDTVVSTQPTSGTATNEAFRTLATIESIMYSFKVSNEQVRQTTDLPLCGSVFCWRERSLRFTVPNYTLYTIHESNSS